MRIRSNWRTELRLTTGLKTNCLDPLRSKLSVWGHPARRLGLIFVGMSSLLVGCDSQKDPTEVSLELVEGEWTCRDCIHMTPILTLGDTAVTSRGPAALESAHSVARDGAGNYWIAQVNSLKVFDAHGNFVADVGRAGQGPGEFETYPGPVFGDRDGNVHVVDNRNRRESIFSPARQLLGDYQLFAHVNDIAAMSDAHVRVVNAHARTSEYVTIPLHLLRRDSVTVSFGGARKEMLIRDLDLRRKITTDTQGHIISAEVYDYIVTLWDEHGRPIRILEGPSINVVPVQSGAWTMETGPPSKIIDLHATADGQLWVMRTERSGSWREHAQEVVSPRGVVGMKIKHDDPNNVLDTYVDVIDTMTGRILATSAAPGRWGGFLGPGLAWQPRITILGVPYITIWRVEER